jgi:adenylate cyclase
MHAQSKVTPRLTDDQADFVEVEYDRCLRFRAERGIRLLDAILLQGLPHRHLCGGHGFCTSCRVEVLDAGSGLEPVSALERDRLGEKAGQLRLACQTILTGDVRIALPAQTSMFSLREGDSLD